jgi:hypothetical protein
MQESAPEWDPVEKRAYFKMFDIRQIASPGFVHLVNLAHEEGLLALILAKDLKAVHLSASELLASLAGQIYSWYPQVPNVFPTGIGHQLGLSGPPWSHGKGSSSQPPVVDGSDDTSDGGGAKKKLVAFAP